MKKTGFFTFTLFVGMLFLFTINSKAALYPFNNTYSGSQEVPANASPATGTIFGVYDDASNTLFFTLSFSGLMTNTVAAHFHSPASPGTNAGVVYGYTGFPTGVSSGTYTGSAVITDVQEEQLKSGLWYSNIHTASLPGGEIRTQITLGPASSSLYTINNTYSGTQENPPNTSPGTGVITGVYDPASNNIFYRIVFSGLLSPTVAAHFHAPTLPGANAGVIYPNTDFPLTVMEGTYSGTHNITDVQETQLLDGLWYHNIHTAQFPGGEIRTQIALAPAGVYCDAKGASGTKGFIKQVFACYSFDNITGWNNGYGNFLNLNVNLAPGKLMGLAITPGYNSNSVQPLLFIRVWIDWNGDGDFGDAGELVFCPYLPTNVKTKAWIRVPATANAGKTRMRIILSANKAATSSCGEIAYGEVEDYSISIAAARFTGNDMIPENFDELNSNTFTIYPKPVSNRMIIERMVFDEDYATNSPAQMQIIDVNGRVVMQKRLLGLVQTVDVNKLASGIYFVTIKTKKGISTQKTIIHR